jgi:hypothetical protein
LAVALLAGTGSAWAQGGATATITGKQPALRVRRVGNEVLVPLTDVARALGMVVTRRGAGYVLTPAGGADAVTGLTGTIGETLFDGKWRFTVLKSETVDRYTLESKTTLDETQLAPFVDRSYEGDTVTLEPKKGRRLIVLRCEVRNARTTPQSLWWYSNDVRNALTDRRAESYPPVAIDIPSASFESPRILPGASLRFAIVFSVPQSAVLKDLVFTLRTLSEPGQDVRVAL